MGIAHNLLKSAIVLLGITHDLLKTAAELLKCPDIFYPGRQSLLFGSDFLLAPLAYACPLAWRCVRALVEVSFLLHGSPLVSSEVRALA